MDKKQADAQYEAVIDFYIEYIHEAIKNAGNITRLCKGQKPRLNGTHIPYAIYARQQAKLRHICDVIETGPWAPGHTDFGA